MADKDTKKPISNTAKVVIGIGIIALAVGAFLLGKSIGFDKGFDKGVGWQ